MRKNAIGIEKQKLFNTNKIEKEEESLLSESKLNFIEDFHKNLKINFNCKRLKFEFYFKRDDLMVIFNKIPFICIFQPIATLLIGDKKHNNDFWLKKTAHNWLVNAMPDALHTGLNYPAQHLPA
ncbi:MAG: hypothetical protein AB9882_07870 [Ignavibacteriaceae bacterium]